MIVVPCYNEELRLPADQFPRFLCDSQVRLVFVDDGSRDKTLDRLESIRKGREDRVFVLRSPANQGKAEAVRTGINFAGALMSSMPITLAIGMRTSLRRWTRFRSLWRYSPRDPIWTWCSARG